MTYQKEFGEFLKISRIRNKKTISDVSADLEISLEKIVSFEKGDSIPQEDVLKRLLNYYNTTLNEMLAYDSSDNNNVTYVRKKDYSSTKKLATNLASVIMIILVFIFVAIDLITTPFLSWSVSASLTLILLYLLFIFVIKISSLKLKIIAILSVLIIYSGLLVYLIINL